MGPPPPLKKKFLKSGGHLKKKKKKKKNFLQKSYFYLKRVQKNFDQKNFFFIRATPLKNRNFSKKKNLHLLILKIFTLSKFHSPMCRNGRNFTKKPKKRQKNRKMAVKRGKNANFKKRFSFFFQVGPILS